MKLRLKIFILIIVVILCVSTGYILKTKNGSQQQKEEEKEVLLIEKEIIYDNIASWYDYDLNRKDQKCKSNNCYSQFNSTCASRDYPRGTMLKVTYKDKSVVCRVNDYGPEEWTNRQIDLSSHAFSSIADLSRGLIVVKIEKFK